MSQDEKKTGSVEFGVELHKVAEGTLYEGTTAATAGWTEWDHGTTEASLDRIREAHAELAEHVAVSALAGLPGIPELPIQKKTKTLADLEIKFPLHDFRDPDFLFHVPLPYYGDQRYRAIDYGAPRPQVDLGEFQIHSLRVDCSTGPNPYYDRVTVVAGVKNIQTGSPDYVSQTTEIPTPYVRRRIKAEIMRLLEHEVDEWLKVDGVQVTDPHPEINHHGRR